MTITRQSKGVLSHCRIATYATHEGSVYFAKGDFARGADLQIFVNEFKILLIHLQKFLNDLGIF